MPAWRRGPRESATEQHPVPAEERASTEHAGDEGGDGEHEDERPRSRGDVVGEPADEPGREHARACAGLVPGLLCGRPDLPDDGRVQLDGERDDRAEHEREAAGELRDGTLGTAADGDDDAHEHVPCDDEAPGRDGGDAQDRRRDVEQPPPRPVLAERANERAGGEQPEEERRRVPPGVLREEDVLRRDGEQGGRRQRAPVAEKRPRDPEERGDRREAGDESRKADRPLLVAERGDRAVREERVEQVVVRGVVAGQDHPDRLRGVVADGDDLVEPEVAVETDEPERDADARDRDERGRDRARREAAAWRLPRPEAVVRRSAAA